MPSLDEVDTFASYWMDGIGVTVMDLAYSEYMDREIDGNHNTHVEAYFCWLAKNNYGPHRTKD